MWFKKKFEESIIKQELDFIDNLVLSKECHFFERKEDFQKPEITSYKIMDINIYISIDIKKNKITLNGIGFSNPDTNRRLMKIYESIKKVEREDESFQEAKSNVSLVKIVDSYKKLPKRKLNK